MLGFDGADLEILVGVRDVTDGRGWSRDDSRTRGTASEIRERTSLPRSG